MEIKLTRVEPPLGRIYNDITKKVELWQEFKLGDNYPMECRVARIVTDIEEYPESHHIDGGFPWCTRCKARPQANPALGEVSGGLCIECWEFESLKIPR